MRGEHHMLEDADGKPVGSSPHARGALQRVNESGSDGGVIPACAGSTISRLLISR